MSGTDGGCQEGTGSSSAASKTAPSSFLAYARAMPVRSRVLTLYIVRGAWYWHIVRCHAVPGIDLRRLVVPGQRAPSAIRTPLHAPSRHAVAPELTW
eukprot:1408497-Rhodomonas_salina.1